MYRRFCAWLSDAHNLRRFAFANFVFWAVNQPIVTAWYLLDRDSFVNGAGILYIAELSVVALWLSSLAWWQSSRVEEKQDQTD